MGTVITANDACIKPGDIVTRSDGLSFLIVDYSTGIVPKPLDGVKKLPLDYRSAQFLIGKHVGDYFYEHGQGNHTIIGIKNTDLTNKYKNYYQQIAHKERIKRERERAEKEARARAEAERRARIRGVQEWFENNIKINGKRVELDDEQAEAVANTNKNTLVAARAGSGKTTTLVAKIIYLVTKQHVSQDEIIAFVFNNDASREINARLSKTTMNGKAVFSNSKIATTFHAFARDIIYTRCGEAEKYGKILCDGKEGDFRSIYIQEIIKLMPKRKIYEFFRDEMFQIKKEKFVSEAEFFESLRSSQYGTLDGKTVKSQSEKIICDFLFEHDIKYYYENEYYLSSAKAICKDEDIRRLKELKDVYKEEAIKPDFFLPEYNIPWEHWAIDCKESQQKIRALNGSGVIGDYYEYRGKMSWKKWFFEKNWIDDTKMPGKYSLQIKQMQPLIETYLGESESREEFEGRIEAILRQRGIYKAKLSEDELISRVWENQVKRFSKMVTQFIDRAELRFTGSFSELEEAIRNYNDNERTKAFLDISLDCYSNYLGNLLGKEKEHFLIRITKNNKDLVINSDAYGIDFSILLKKAIEAIRQNKSVELNEHLARQKYLLIDEYQDFSELFLQLVLAVRDCCPDARLFAVGDDWQAINRFAGSDTEYFNCFAEYFSEEPCRLEITTNYRSKRNIVEGARVFMSKSLNEHGDFVANDPTDGFIQIVDPSETFISYKGYEDDIYKNIMAPSEKRNPRKYSVQYLKTVAEIILKNKDSKKIMLLHRNNDLSFWMSINSFYRKLRRAMVMYRYMTEQEFDEKVEIKTMHRAKGLQAETVIILEADEGVIPAYHQDTCLYEIFGDSEETAMIDQKKLFYVAITRPEKKLYILHKYDKHRNGFIDYCDYPSASKREELPF